MKKIFVLLLTVMLALGCVGCPNGRAEENVSLKEDIPIAFVAVGKVTGGIIMRCEQTNVLYVMSKDAYNYGNYTVLVNPDGTPMLWED